ncbi:MAG: hypothetical protein AB7K41_03825 [Bdellovibrionales bacterium]
MKQLGLRLSLVAMAMMSLVNCGDENTISKQVNFQIHPKTPIVILSDFTLNAGTDNEVEITAPWFAVNYTVVNNSTKPITIQSLLFKVMAITTTGVITTSTVTVKPSDYTGAENEAYLDEVLAGATSTPTFTIFADGLEKDVLSLTYSVECEVQGWVGTGAVPEDRLYKTVSFSTK